MRAELSRRAQHVDWLIARLVHPRHRLTLLAQRLQGLSARLGHAHQRYTHQHRAALLRLSARLLHCTPLARVRASQMQCRHLYARIERECARRVDRHRDRLQQLTQSLDALSPLRTLARGYAVALNTRTGVILRDAATVQPGDTIDVRLARGRLRCAVTERKE
jgi:exodeoxyribonuclease VII large subunit